MHEQLIAALEHSGIAFISSTRLRGRFAMRMCIMNFTTRDEDIAATIEFFASRAGRFPSDPRHGGARAASLPWIAVGSARPGCHPAGSDRPAAVLRPRGGSGTTACSRSRERADVPTGRAGHRPVGRLARALPRPRGRRSTSPATAGVIDGARRRHDRRDRGTRVGGRIWLCPHGDCDCFDRLRVLVFAAGDVGELVRGSRAGGTARGNRPVTSARIVSVTSADRPRRWRRLPQHELRRIQIAFASSTARSGPSGSRCSSTRTTEAARRWRARRSDPARAGDAVRAVCVRSRRPLSPRPRADAELRRSRASRWARRLRS